MGNRAGRWISAAFVVGAVIRIGLWFAFPKSEETLWADAEWYWNAGKTLAWHGVFGVDPSSTTFTKPPAFPVLLAGVVRLFGPSLTAAAVTLAAVSATGTFLIAAIARRLEGPAWLPAVCAIAYALSPVQCWYPRSVMSESVVTPLALAFVWWSLRCREEGGALRFLALGGLGALLTHFRLDLAAWSLGLPVLAGMCLHGGRWSAGRRVGLASWAVVAALALCLPWSMYASSVQGAPVFIYEPPPVPPFRRWLSTRSLSADELRESNGAARRYELAGPRYSRLLFRDEGEKQRIVALTRELNAGGDAAQAAEELDRLTNEEIRQRPLRYYLWLPVERAVRMWFTVENYGRFRLFGSTDPGVLLYSVWALPFACVAVLGFLGGPIWLLACWRSPAALVAGAIYLRTFSLTLAGALSGWSLIEARYLVFLEPLAVGLGLVTAYWAWSRAVQRRDAASAEPGRRANL